MRHHPFSRCLAAFLAAVILLNAPGPDALAAGMAAVRPIPAGRMDAPLGSLGTIHAPGMPGQAGSTHVRFEAPVLPTLPGIGAPSVEMKDISPAVPAAPVSAESPAALAAPEAKSQDPGVETQGRSFFGLFRRSSGNTDIKKRLEKAREQAVKDASERAKEQKTIDRVLEISIKLEKAENDGNVNDEELRKTADQVWGLDSGTASLPDPVETSQTVGKGKAQVLPRRAKDQPKTRGPPAVETVGRGAAGADVSRPSLVGRVVSTVLQGIATVIGAVRKSISIVFSPVTRAWAALPSGMRVTVATALTVGADFSARLLMPAVFGFVPGAGLWVTVGLGGFAIPALALTRRALVRQNDPALAPLVRYADVLMGVLLGAAAVTGLGVFNLDLPAALIGAFQKGSGIVSLAPLLGVFGFMASLPVLYGAGHVAWGLKNKTKTDPDLPIPFMYKVMLFSAVLSPIQFFVALSGGLPGMLGTLAIYAAIMTYFRSQKMLAAMTAAHAEPKPAVVEEKTWRLDLVEGPATTPAEQLRRSRIQAALWSVAIVVGAIGILALHQFSLIAALAIAGPKLLSSIKFLIPMGLLGGFLVTIFMKVKKVAAGPYVDTVRELADKAGLPMPKVHAGKTTGAPNAFAAGALYHLAVVAVVGMISRMMTVREMRGILGHELSHVKFRHMLSFFLAIPFLQVLSIGSISIFHMALMYWAPILWTIAVLGLTRANERMADAGGAKVTGDARGLATGLRKLALLGMVSDKMPHREGSWLYRLFLSHPDPLERVQTLGRMIKAEKKTPPTP
ncbi:MAG: M48 family metalloprotease [Elusimicrobia bacterium]|nr:M48 family metalloprotease [Elusimicrobiota bacterium]